MQKQRLEKCISELSKPSKNRNEKFITDYLKSLKPLMMSLKEKCENSEEMINKLSLIMNYQKYDKNIIIFQYGEKVNDLYLILNGNAVVLTPKFNEYYMNKEEFILYLLKLRKNDQKELLSLCIKYNAFQFSFNHELLNNCIFNLEKHLAKIESIFNSKIIFNEAKEVVKYMRLKSRINKNTHMKKFSPEKYISLLQVLKI